MTLTACASAVERGDPDRFLATMAAPVDARAVMFPLFAFNLEVARIPWATQEPIIAEMRLQWWRDTVRDLCDGAPARGHEIAAPLGAVIARGALPYELLEGLIDARRWDVARDPFEDQADFDGYIEASSGNLIWAAARALGAAPGDEPAVRAHAYANGVASFLRAVPALEAAGRVPLLDGRPDGVRALAQGALDRLAGVPVRFGAATPALRSCWQGKALLSQVVRNPACVADGTLTLPEGRKRLSLMARVALRRA